MTPTEPNPRARSRRPPRRPHQITPDDFAKHRPSHRAHRGSRLVEGADRLLKLSVDLGGERRTVFAGIRGAYEPAAARRPPHRRRREPQAEEDALRHRRRAWRSPPPAMTAFPPLAGRRRQSRHEGQLSAAMGGDAETLAARIDALLPQTQCRRCGFDACRPYAEALARGETALNRCPPGGAALIDELAALLGRPRLPLDPSCGAEARAARRLDRRARLHRLRPLHRALPDRRHRRRPQAHAHGHRRGLQRLRALRARLPRGLHPHDPGAGPAGRAAAARRDRGARAAFPQALRCAARPARARTWRR